MSALQRTFSGRTFERGRSVALYGRRITARDAFDASPAVREAEQRLHATTLPPTREGQCAHITCGAPFERGALGFTLEAWLHRAPPRSRTSASRRSVEAIAASAEFGTDGSFLLFAHLFCSYSFCLLIIFFCLLSILLFVSGIAFDRNRAALVGWVHDSVVVAELRPVAGSGGTWLHVALRSDGATLALLFDGAEVATCAVGAHESAVKCEPRKRAFRIGAAMRLPPSLGVAVVTARSAPLSVCDVRLWGSALAASQLAAATQCAPHVGLDGHGAAAGSGAPRLQVRCSCLFVSFPCSFVCSSFFAHHSFVRLRFIPPQQRLLGYWPLLDGAHGLLDASKSPGNGNNGAWVEQRVAGNACTAETPAPAPRALVAPTLRDGVFDRRFTSGARFILAGAVSGAAASALVEFSGAGIVLCEDKVDVARGCETFVALERGSCAIHLVRSSFWALGSLSAQRALVSARDAAAPPLADAATDAATDAADAGDALRCLTVAATRSRTAAGDALLRIEVWLRRGGDGATRLLGMADSLCAPTDEEETNGCEDARTPNGSTVRFGECSFMYRYISRESCSQFDSLPLTSLTDKGFTVRFGAQLTVSVRGRELLVLPVDAAAVLRLRDDEAVWLALSSSAATPSAVVSAWRLSTLQPPPSRDAVANADVENAAPVSSPVSSPVIYFPDTPDDGDGAGASNGAAASKRMDYAAAVSGAPISSSSSGAAAPSTNAARRAIARELAELVAQSVDLCEYALGVKGDSKNAAMNWMFDDLAAVQSGFALQLSLGANSDTASTKASVLLCTVIFYANLAHS